MLCKNKVKKAKGANNVKIFIIIYRKEYVKIKFNRLIDIKLLNNPFIENKLKSVSFKVIILFKSCIKEEKHISLPNKFSPIPRIASETLEISSINISHINGEKLSKIEKTITRNIKAVGLIFSENVKCENNSETP